MSSPLIWRAKASYSSVCWFKQLVFALRWWHNSRWCSCGGAVVWWSCGDVYPLFCVGRLLTFLFLIGYNGPGMRDFRQFCRLSFSFVKGKPLEERVRRRSMEGRVSALERAIEKLREESGGNFQELKDMMKEMLQKSKNHKKGLEGSEKSVMKGKKEGKTGMDAEKDSLQNITKGKKFSEEGEFLANDEEKKEERYPQSTKPYEEGEKLLRPGAKTMVSWSNPIEVLVSMGVSTIAVIDPYPEISDVIKPTDLASGNGHKGISNYLAKSLSTSHLELLTMEEGKDGRKETSGMEVVQTVSEQTATLVLYRDIPDVIYLKDSLNAVQNATQVRKQLARHDDDDDDEFGWSNQQALSFLASRMNKSGQGEGLANAAVIQIQKKFQHWKKGKEFLIIRQRIEKKQFLSLIEQEESTILSYRPPPKPPDLNWRAVASGFPSYDNTFMKMSHGNKLHYSNLEDKVVKVSEVSFILLEGPGMRGTFGNFSIPYRATSYLTLNCIKQQKNALRSLFASEEWATSPHGTKSDGNQVMNLVLSDDRFWRPITYCLKCVIPLVKVLRLVDGDAKPAMPYIYEALDRAKEKIAENFQKIETRYKRVWKIIDTRWNLQLQRPLNAAAYYLNSRCNREENEDINEGEELSVEDEDDLSDVDLGEDEDEM
ncbi:hypothetical protein V8G54_000850 [Vigna mungo]|uniref:Uncharacterized protein n=1 Tax=Vigna mungo TaxID=3915 RepID=A0AAQ3SAX9_VIGMU